MNNEQWMKEAIKEAKLAEKEGEVPVGAVIVLHDKIIGRGHNQVETLNDPTAHAEIIAITSATNTILNWRLNDGTIYVTVEPCPMCAGAIMLSRISTCVFGTKDLKLGGLGSVFTIKRQELQIIHGILETECNSIIKSFFTKTREENKNCRLNSPFLKYNNDFKRTNRF